MTDLWIAYWDDYCDGGAQAPLGVFTNPRVLTDLLNREQQRVWIHDPATCKERVCPHQGTGCHYAQRRHVFKLPEALEDSVRLSCRGRNHSCSPIIFDKVEIDVRQTGDCA